MQVQPVSTSPAFHHKPFVWLRNKLLAGIALALPLVITAWILWSVYSMLKGLSDFALGHIAWWVNDYSGETAIDIESTGYKQFVSFVGFLIPLLAFVFLGVMATNVIGVRVVTAFDQLLLRVPVVSFLYKSLKQVIDAFKGLGGKQNFKRAVYVDYPSAGAKMLGFATGQFYDTEAEKTMVSVFIPGALSPMTGLLLVIEEDKVTDAPISIEDAMKLIFSGGLVVPGTRRVSRPAEETSPVPAAELTEIHLTKDLPPNLPRAEDFDFGDPDILASSSELGDTLLTTATRKARNWGLMLPWRRRS